MARRRKGRAVNGILLLNKPTGITSNKALQICRAMFKAQKAGHTGALDPLATGVLPICFGEATKFSQFLLNADKRYEADIVLGQTTDSGDSDGEILTETDASAVTQQALEQELAHFRGPIQQIPPMYSALKHQGQPLYKLARQGIILEREPRSVTIHALELLNFQAGQLASCAIDVTCSKGTYIRSLAMDIGGGLNVGGHISKLHRTAVDNFEIAQTVSLDDLQKLVDAHADDDANTQQKKFQLLDALLLPTEKTLQHFSAVQLDEALAKQICMGQNIQTNTDNLFSTLVRFLLHDGTFIGLGEVIEPGVIKPKRLIAQDQKP